MKRNMYQWVDEVIAAPRKTPIPVLSFPSVQKLGGTVQELTHDSDKQAKGLKLIADSFPTGASVSYMDLSVEAEAFGSDIRYSGDEVPTVVGSIVDDMDSAEALKIPAVGDARTGMNLDAIRKAVPLITDRPVFAGVIGPWSLAGRLMDVSEAMYYCFDEPEMVHLVLDKVTAFLIDYMNAYKDTGAHGIVMAEPLAGLLSGDLAEEFSAAYVRRIVEAVQDENFLIVYHNCGNSALATIDTIVSNGCRVFHFGNAVAMDELMPHIPANCIALGNVDPAREFRNGTPESVYAATTAVMEKCASFPNFVPSSGCDIPPMTDWENINAFFRAVDDFYNR